MAGSAPSRTAIAILIATAAALCFTAGAEATVSFRTKAKKPQPVPVTRKVCFWHENNGTSFGISGQCYVGPATPVGTPCDCDRTVEHAVQHHAGKVIEIPQGDGSGGLH